MSDVTYIRITIGGTTQSGETGTWIPVSDLDLAAMNIGPGSKATGSLAFTLADDDAIESTLNGAIDTGAGLQIEVATYDNSTASSTSAGTLLSYAVSTNALITAQSTSSTTISNRYTLKLSNISQTTYPPGGSVSQSAFSYTNNAAVAPTAVPASVVSGASVAQSTSTAPAPSSLTNYAQFATAKGTYLTNANGGTWFAIGDVSAGLSNPSQGTVNLLPLSFDLTDQAVSPTLLKELANGTILYGVQVEALSGSRVVDNTTYETAGIASLSNAGGVTVDYSAYYAQHFTAKGGVSASGWNSQTKTTDTSGSAITEATPTNVSAGQPTNGYFLTVSGLTGDTAAPTDARSVQLLGRGATGFVPSSASFGASATTTVPGTGGAGGNQVSLGDLDLTSSSQVLGLHADGLLFNDGHDATFTLANYSGGTATGSDQFAEVFAASDEIDLVSGAHSMAFAYQTIAETNFTSSSSGNTATSSTSYDVKTKTTSDAVAERAASRTSAGEAAPSADPTSSSASAGSVRSDAVAAAAAPANTSYIQFRDADGNIISSSSGETWFAVNAATTGFSRAIDVAAGTSASNVSVSDLNFVIGQDAISGTLDSDLVAGTTLTAEVATYSGSSGALQSDYVFSGGAIDAHGAAAGSSAQSFSLATTSFQETQYSASTSKAIGTVTYNQATGKAGTAATQTINATSSAPTTSNAAPQADTTYVQFVGSNGAALTDSSGSSYFKISGTASGLSVLPNGKTSLGALSLKIGDDQVTSQLDADFYNKTTLGSINVVTYNPNGTVESAQSYDTATVATDVVDNTGGDHAYSFTYTGYGETIAGTTTPNSSSATVGTTTTPTGTSTTPTAPDLTTATAADVGAATPPSLSTLAFYGRLEVPPPDETNLFVGSPKTGFIALPDFAIDLSQSTAANTQSLNLSYSTASFEVDQAQAATLAAGVDVNGKSQFEIAGYNSAATSPGSMDRSIDYILGGVFLESSSVDPTTGLDAVTLGYASLQETKKGSTTITEGPGGTQHLDAPTDAPPAVCFAAGTRIRVVRHGATADVAVEELRVGDLAVTASGAHRPIRWLGHSKIDCLNHPRPDAVIPVRIRAHAFGENRPARDLFVSPGHAIALDLLGEVLIPAYALINGLTIVAEPVDRVTYWHVELDSHDILIAENQAAESYLDMGNRAFFAHSTDDGTVVDLTALPDAGPAGRTSADFCRPFHERGALVETVCAQMRRRAVELGWRVVAPQPWTGVRLEVDGESLLPEVDPDTSRMSARFALPPAARDIWLICPTAVPAEVDPDNGDARALGLCLAEVIVEDGCGLQRRIDLADPRLCVGFHRIEPDHRWTAGVARLPADLFGGMSGPAFLRLNLFAPPLPRWQAPEQEPMAASGTTAQAGVDRPRLRAV